VLAAEEPTRMRGGPLLGGKRGLYDTFVGQTTRYVVNKAPCRVILTAPPGDGAAPALPKHITQFAPPPTGDPVEAAAAGNGGISDADAAATGAAG
jgi:APA family basic amino acid/polyamine antiporter